MTSDLSTVLEDLGVEVKRESGDEIQGRCPVHHLYKGRESSRFSWYINSTTGLWHCFTCGARGNLPLLVSSLTNDPYAITRVHTFLIEAGLDRLNRDADYEEPEPEADWRRFAQFSDPPKKLLSLRGISVEAARRFGIRFDKEDRLIIIPVISPDGDLLGWQGKGIRGLFLNTPEGLHKSKTLFGLIQAQAPIALLVESPLDVVRFHTVHTGGEVSALASFGASVSSTQLSLLRNSFDGVIIGMDNDSAGIMEARRLVGAARKQPLNLLSGFRKGVRFLDYTGIEAKDVGDMTDSQVEECIKRATIIRP